MGGSASAYKINVDGVSGVTRSTTWSWMPMTVYHVFVQVNVDPTAANLPFIIRDSVESGPTMGKIRKMYNWKHGGKMPISLEIKL
jgi:hypothetical protein